MADSGVRLDQQGSVVEAVETAEYFINKGYLDHLVDYSVVPMQSNEQSYRYIRLCQVEKIIYDKEEDVIDKLVSVYGALAQFVNHVVLFIVGRKDGVKLCRILICTCIRHTATGRTLRKR